MQEIEWRYGGPISEEDIRSVESRLAVVFPGDFRTFIIEHNGARPRPNTIDIPGKREVVMERLVRLDAGSKENVTSVATAVRKLRQGNLVPFASDPFGNLFCFQYAGKVASAVVFWDHESGSTSVVCKTFSELLGLLHAPRR